MVDCAGHFGYIKLECVFHIGYFKNIINVLQCVCKGCSRILLSEEDQAMFLRRYRNPKIEMNQRRRCIKSSPTSVSGVGFVRTAAITTA